MWLFALRRVKEVGGTEWKVRGGLCGRVGADGLGEGQAVGKNVSDGLSRIHQVGFGQGNKKAPILLSISLLLELSKIYCECLPSSSRKPSCWRPSHKNNVPHKS